MLKTLWLRLPVLVRYIVSLLIPVLIVLGALALVSHYEHSAAAKWGALAKEQQTKIVQLEAKAQAKDQAIAQRDAALADQESVVAKLKVARMAAPPIPAYLPPPDDPTLHAQLQDAGLQHPPTERPDAVLVWDWHMAAVQLPAYKDQLAAQDKFAAGLETLTSLQKTQIQDLTAARDTWRDTAGLEAKRSEALQGQAVALGKAVAAERRQKWIIGGVAVGGFVYLAARKK